MTARTICLNADIGELPGDVGRNMDRAILDVVTRCNIAAGGHAGDAESMSKTMHAAKARGVEIGVHPSYPDRENFGRSPMTISAADLEEALGQQLRTFQSIARQEGVSVAYLKPHGALYNEAAKSPELAQLVADQTRRHRIPALMGQPGSEMEAAAGRTGLNFISEGFVDRQYSSEGRLVPRSEPGSVLEDFELQIEQAIHLARDHIVIARNGQQVGQKVETLCVHGDTPGAIHSAYALKQALLAEGFELKASSRP